MLKGKGIGKKHLILPTAAAEIMGERPKTDPAKESVSDEGKEEKMEQMTAKAHDEAGDQHGDPQLIRAVSSSHKMPKS